MTDLHTRPNSSDLNEMTLRRLHTLGRRQWDYENSVINLIASDNATPLAQMMKPPYTGSMIQEGLRDQRPFAGASLHDEIEGLAEEIACRVFNAEHANLQPHSCSQANQAAYHALLDHGDVVLALGFKAGGHLTHGLKINFSGRAYNFSFYGTGSDAIIDYEAARQKAIAIKPKVIVCGSSSYPRLFDAKKLRMIADEVGALLMFDLSHEAGLIAGGAIDNPVPLADVATMSLDKTLRGPFGGIVLCRSTLAKSIDVAIHPGTQSSFPIRKLTDSAHALLLTQTESFSQYAHAVLDNAKELERVLGRHGIPMVTGGTDKHYIVLNVIDSIGITGTEAEQRLERVGILSSRQTLPSDTSSRTNESGGLRLGAAWMTSRGYQHSDVTQVAEVLIEALQCSADALPQLKERVASLVATKRPDDVWGDTDA